jgi:hypothetical protein
VRASPISALAPFDSLDLRLRTLVHSFTITTVSVTTHVWRNMNKVFSQLAKQQSKLFKVNYSPEYKTFITNHVLADQSHPLHEVQRRRARERKQEGLWWHVTTGADLSKSSCVRSWSRRRLRNAIVEELRARGYDENGMRIVPKITNGDDATPMKAAVGPSTIQGSLRLHAQAPLIPAKFTDVKTEVGTVVDIILGASNHSSHGTMSNKKSRDWQQRKPVPKSQQKRPRVSQR